MNGTFQCIAIVVLVNCTAPGALARTPATGSQAPSAEFVWKVLAPLPDDRGRAGGFAGVSHGAMIFAGGVNCLDAPRAGGTEVFHDSIFVLRQPEGRWTRLERRLPRPLAHGASVTHDDKLICIGGDDGKKVHGDVVSLQWKDNRVVIEQLPPLPRPCTFCCGGLIGDEVYVAGGVDQLPGRAEEALNTFWVLNLKDSEAGWKELTPWPGPERTGAVSAVLDEKLYIVSGLRIEGTPADAAKKTSRVLTDGYRYSPPRAGQPGRWERIADLLREAAAAASPAPAIGQQHFLVIGGMDNTAARSGEHAPRPTHCLAYHAITDTWTPMGAFPDEETAPVDLPAVQWGDAWVILGGQTRPGAQSPKVISVKVRQKRRALGFLNLSILLIYLGALVGVGIYFSTREKTTADYFVGGRRIPWWVAGVSILGTTLSSITFMAVPAKVYSTDWLYFILITGDVLVPLIVVFFYMPFFRRLDVTSAYEYLEKRFNLLVRLFGSASFVFFQTGRMTIVLFLPALALAAVTGINIYVCILMIGLLATLYTFLGGIEAVIWTDLLQVIVLLGGALISLAIIALSVDGGVPRIVQMAQADHKLDLLNLGWDYTAPVLWVIVVGGVFQNLVTYSADQAVIQRYLTTKDEKATARALYLNAALAVPLALIFYALGTALYGFYKTRPELLSPALSTDQTLPLFIAQQLPPGVMGLVIAALFAASMSTVDSSLNSISAAITTDFFRRFRPSALDRSCLNLARGLTILFGITATGAALWMAASQAKIMSLWDVYIKILGLLMGSLAGLFALGIFTRRANAAGALVGAAAGAGILFCVQQYTKTHGILYAAVGIFACFSVGYLASLVIPAGEKNLDGITIYTRRPRKQ